MAGNLDDERKLFRSHVVASERFFSAGDADSANVEIKAVERIVQRWRAEGVVVEALRPLTDESETPAVRFNAAAGLLGTGHTDVALPALEELARAKLGTASLDAGVLVKSWQRREGTPDA